MSDFPFLPRDINCDHVYNFKGGKFQVRNFLLCLFQAENKLKPFWGMKIQGYFSNEIFIGLDTGKLTTRNKYVLRNDHTQQLRSIPNAKILPL